MNFQAVEVHFAGVIRVRHEYSFPKIKPEPGTISVEIDRGFGPWLALAKA